MDKSKDLSGPMSSLGAGRQGGLSASSSTSNISSSFRQSLNGSSGSSSRPSFRSRLGALARSAINDSAEAGCQLSPNTRKGMISVRSHLGLPPLENPSASNSHGLSKTPPSPDNFRSASISPSLPESESNTNSQSQGYVSSTSSQEFSSTLKSVEALRGSEHTVANESIVTERIPVKNDSFDFEPFEYKPIPMKNQENLYHAIEHTCIPPMQMQSHYNSYEIPQRKPAPMKNNSHDKSYESNEGPAIHVLPSPAPALVKAENIYKDTSIELEHLRLGLPTAPDQNQNVPPRHVSVVTPVQAYGNQARSHSMSNQAEVSLRRSASMDPLLKRKPFTMSHNKLPPPLEILTPVGSRRFPTSSSKNIIIKTPILKPPVLSFLTSVKPEPDLPAPPVLSVTESNPNNNRMPLTPVAISNHDNPVPSLSSSSLNSNNKKVEVEADKIIPAPILSAREFCPPPAPPAPLAKPKLARSVKRAGVPSSRRRNVELCVQGKWYAVINRLGKGGCGEVFLVTDMETQKLYALKTVNLAGLNESSVDECVNEVKMLEELKDTELVIQIVSWERNYADQTMKIVMEYGQCDLSKLITNRPDVSELKVIWKRMLRIVESIHKKGIVHADLKPANFVLVDGRLKIIDFGISNRLQIDHTSIATLNPKGTLNFISPETITPDAFGRTKMSPKSDIWSLGCILHLMIFGSTPFQGITHAQAKMSAIMNGVNSYPPLPAGFSCTTVLSVLKLCFEKDPKKRPTAAELLTHPFLRECICH